MLQKGRPGANSKVGVEAKQREKSMRLGANPTLLVSKYDLMGRGHVLKGRGVLKGFSGMLPNIYIYSSSLRYTTKTRFFNPEEGLHVICVKASEVTGCRDRHAACTFLLQASLFSFVSYKSCHALREHTHLLRDLTVPLKIEETPPTLSSRVTRSQSWCLRRGRPPLHVVR